MNLWAFECLLLFVSWIGKTELAAYLIVITLTQFLIQVPKGIGEGAMQLVKHSLNQNYPLKAKKYAYTGIAFGVISGIFFAWQFILFGDKLGSIFTNDDGVTSNFEILSRLVALLILADHVQIVETGVLKAMGYKRYSELTLICSMILVGVPTSYYLAFNANWGIKGAYLGIILSIIIVAFLFSMNLFAFIDWPKLSEESHRQTEMKRKKSEFILINI